MQTMNSTSCTAVLPDRSDGMSDVPREILVVDDDPIIRRVIQASLAEEGHQASICQDGQSAWERIANDPPAMVITDWIMPGMSGIELTRLVRESCKTDIYVLVATSRNSEEDSLQAIEAGADDFLAKPISQQELIARVKRGMSVLDRMDEEAALSSRDPLTSAYNRRAFDLDCAKRIQQSHQDGSPLSCVLLDIDFFKHINDTYGHSAGDQALQVVAKSINDHLRSDDRLYRYGGDEFCILLPSVDDAIASKRVKQILGAISKIELRAGDRKFHIRCSAGIASWREDIRAPGQLVDLADEALLLAKKSGRNQVKRLKRLDSADKLCVDADAMATVRADALMLTPPLTAQRGTSIGSLANELVGLRIDSLPVVDEDNHLVGVVAEQDLFQQMPQGNGWNDPIDSVMQTNFVSFEADTPVDVIWDFFRRIAFNRVVIVDKNRPIGTITRSMLLRWAAAYYFREKQPQLDTAASSRAKRIDDLTSTITTEMKQLQERVEKGSGNDVVPALVCGATRLQEQSDQLLGYARSMTNQSRQGDTQEPSVGFFY